MEKKNFIEKNGLKLGFTLNNGSNNGSKEK